MDAYLEIPLMEPCRNVALQNHWWSTLHSNRPFTPQYYQFPTRPNIQEIDTE